MRRTRQAFLLGLGLALLLAGCAAPEAEEPPSSEASVLGEASGLPEEEALLTVDGRPAPAWQYLYWLASACDQVRASYEAAGAALDWAAPVGGGTLADYVKQQALADTALYATVENWAEHYRCPLEAEDEADIEAEWGEQAEAAGGEEAYLAELAGCGLDRDRARTLAGTGRLYAKLWELYEAKAGPFQPPAPQPETMTVDRILVAYGEDPAAARERVEELFSRLNTAADQGAEFAALAAASDDAAGPRTFLAGDETLPAPLEDAALCLAPGQLSGILESEEGFSILRRLDGDAAPPEDEQIVNFDQLLQDAAAAAEVETTAAYAGIDPARFAEALQNARTARGFSSG